MVKACEYAVSWSAKGALHNYTYLKTLTGKAPRLYVEEHNGRWLVYFLIVGDISTVRDRKLRSHLEMVNEMRRITLKQLKERI